uniref:Uncharacterized protein n=1 Tax=Arundo donax TaxID=35708 RepID=A0A0A9ANJ1_ARUDO
MHIKYPTLKIIWSTPVTVVLMTGRESVHRDACTSISTTDTPSGCTWRENRSHRRMWSLYCDDYFSLACPIMESIPEKGIPSNKNSNRQKINRTRLAYKLPYPALTDLRAARADRIPATRGAGNRNDLPL